MDDFLQLMHDELSGLVNFLYLSMNYHSDLERTNLK